MDIDKKEDKLVDKLGKTVKRVIGVLGTLGLLSLGLSVAIKINVTNISGDHFEQTTLAEDKEEVISAPLSDSILTPAPMVTSNPAPTAAPIAEPVTDTPPKEQETPEENGEFSSSRIYEETEPKTGITFYCVAYTVSNNGKVIFEVINKFTDPERTVFHSLYEVYAVDGDVKVATEASCGIWPSTVKNPDNDPNKEYDFYEGSFDNFQRKKGTMSVYKGIDINLSDTGIIRYKDITGLENTGFVGTTGY